MFLKQRSLVAAAIVALAAVGGCDNPPSSDDKIVVKVNGTAITEADMRFADEEIGSKLGDISTAEKRPPLVAYLIHNQLFADAAEAANLPSDPAFEQRMRYLQRRLLNDMYLKTKRDDSAVEAEAKKFYGAKIAKMKTEDEVAARHILVDSEEKAKELHQKIVDGGDFAELAKENSTHAGSKANGGLLPYSVRGAFTPEFAEVVFKMLEGNVSKPVKTALGWHVIKLEDRRRREPPTFEDAKASIIDYIANMRMQQEEGALFEKAQIEYVDADIKKTFDEIEKKRAEQKAKEIEKKQADQNAKDSGAAPKE